jgi:hypothetical protein
MKPKVQRLWCGKFGYRWCVFLATGGTADFSTWKKALQIALWDCESFRERQAEGYPLLF